MTDTQAIPTTADIADVTLGELATSMPGATAVFRTEKLDFCCGGSVTLREAAAAKALDLTALTAKLELLAQGAGPVVAPLATDSLIDLIVERYHRAHQRELPELIRLARRVEAVHRDDASVPAGLAGLLERVLGELTAHMQKEEIILFPRMRRGRSPMIRDPIAAMMAEHDDHGTNLRALEALTSDFTPPEGACTTWRALYTGLRKFADDLVEHISIENNILFPRFAA